MKQHEDLTGRRSMARNVIWSWAGHLVFVVSGFVMPRMIDYHIGQELLGIWDFCWSLASYLNLASLGIGSSVNRYVASYRAAGEVNHLCRAISSVVAIQLLIGVIVVAATVSLSLLLPTLVGSQLGAHVHETKVVVLFLGLSVAVQMALDAFRGVITGCHRWDLHNGIQSASYAVTIVAMLASLMSGGGIVSLSVMYFAGTVLGEGLRAVLALRVCPELRIRRSYVSWSYGKTMVVFGGKTLLLAVPPLVITQTVNVHVAAILGPSALAVLSRPLGLVRHSETLLGKFSYMLSPMAGSIQGENKHAEQRELLLYGTRWSVAMALPASLGLAFLGDPLIRIWMGAGYVHDGLVPLLALGLFLPIAHTSAVQILVGMNLHGRAGLYSAAWVTAALVAGILLLNSVGWTLNGAAALIVVAMVPAYGILLPAYLCRHLKVSFGEYVRSVFFLPGCCGVVLAAILLATRLLLGTRPLIAVLVGTVFGGTVTVLLYAKFLLSTGQRERLLASLTAVVTKVLR